MTPPAKPRRVTIYDVAEKAGVSPSTVSRAFSRPGRVSDETAARIREAAEELGYRSQAVTSPTMLEKARLIGLLVSDVTNPFFFSIIRGAEHAAAAEGYSIVLMDAAESGTREREVLDRVLPVCDALIVATSRLSDEALRGVARRVPTVVMNRRVQGLPGVVTDNVEGMRMALEHLHELGHRRVVYVAGPSASWADGVRWRAFAENVGLLGFTGARVGPAAPTVRGGQQFAEKVRDARTTSVICFNDLVAIGLMGRLAELGVRTPADISIIGFDNTFASDLVTPGLTTVASPLAKLGQQATQAVISLLRGRTNPDQAAIMPSKLVVRGSTAKLR